MGIYSRSTPYLALLGILALGTPTALRAQQPTNAPSKDTSATAQSDTGAYQGYQRNDSTADTSQAGQGGYKYNGPPSDTALKAKPGVQTGPTADSSQRASGAGGVTASADTVVCKDGSNAAKTGGNGCASHGGIDWAATKSAMKARGQMQMGDSTGAAADTSSSKDSSSSSQKP
jgi:hypothetical protein